jgi:hypothetical protein
LELGGATFGLALAASEVPTVARISNAVTKRVIHFFFIVASYFQIRNVPVDLGDLVLLLNSPQWTNSLSLGVVLLLPG